MPDISSELDTIKNDVRGANVKQAIYDALVKVNEAKSPDPSTTSAPVGKANAYTKGTTTFSMGKAERQYTTIDLTNYDLRVCSFNDNTGELTEGSGTGKIGTFSLVPIPNLETIMFVNAVTNSQQQLEWFCYLYDENENYLKSQSSTYYDGNAPYNWKTASVSQSLPSSAKYVRIGFRISSSLPSLTVDDVTSAVARF